jgi:hypothetical protein
MQNLNEIENEAILSIKNYLLKNYQEQTPTPNNAIRKMSEEFSRIIRESLEPPLFTKMKDKKGIFYQFSELSRPTQIKSINDMIDEMKRLDKQTIFVGYHYIDALGKSLYYFFSSDEYAIRYFCDKKHDMQLTWSSQTINEDHRIIYTAKSKKTPERALQLIFRGNVAEFCRKVTMPTIPITDDIEYMLDVSDERTCKILPYLLTSYTVRQFGSSLFRSNARRQALYGFRTIEERNPSRDKRNITRLAELFAFPNEEQKSSEYIHKNDDNGGFMPMIIELADIYRQHPNVIAAVFSLWVNILDKEESLKDLYDLRTSILLLQCRTHCFDMESIRKPKEDDQIRSFVYNIPTLKNFIID